MSKRILSLVLALVMVLGTFGTVFAAETGNDKIDWLVEQGIVTGNASGDLMLDKNIDRASVAKMVAEALGQKTAAAGMQGIKSVFADVPANHWSNGNINVVHGLGLMIGNNGKFMPSSTISYAEVVTILVRMMNGFTAEEAKTAVWPASYIAKANELGILEDVTVANFSAAAVRKDILEMFYNAMINKEVGNYSVVKAIVLENYRVEALDKNEVVVEIIEEVQRSQYVTESRDKKGDQVRFTIDAKVGDVEDLLGKVANFTLDKNGKVVKVQVDNSYGYYTGEFKATKNKLGKYTVELDERYNKKDERVFRTYFNNKPYAYEDFYQNPETVKENKRPSEFTADYARITVKNGKVLFIDAFKFEDVAPVYKTSNTEITILDDHNNTEAVQKDIRLKDITYVINVKDGKLTVGNKEDIAVNDVIHYTGKTFFVRKDAQVTGVYSKIKTDKVDNAEETYVILKDKDAEYELNYDDSKKAVYTKDSKRFNVLNSTRPDNQLSDFRDTEVLLLVDMNDQVQFISADVEQMRFVALVDDVLGRAVKLAREDGENVAYDVTFDSILSKDRTRENRLSSFFEGELVSVEVNADKEIVRMNSRHEELDTFSRTNSVVDKITKDYVTIGSINYRITRDTKIFIDTADVRKGVTVDELTKDFVTTVDSKNLNAPANVRARLIQKNNDLDVIIFTDLESKSTYDTSTVRVDYIYSDYSMRVENTKGEFTTYDLTSALIRKDKIKDVKVGDVITLDLTKEDTPKIADFTIKLVHGNTVGKVTEVLGNGDLVLEFTNKTNVEVKLSRTANKFGGSIRRGDKVEYITNTAGYATIVAVVSSTTKLTPAPDTIGEDGVIKGGVLKGYSSSLLGNRVLIDDKRYEVVDIAELNGFFADADNIGLSVDVELVDGIIVGIDSVGITKGGNAVTATYKTYNFHDVTVGSVVVNADFVELKDANITKDLTINSVVKKFKADDVNVAGAAYVNGGDNNTVAFANSKLNLVKVNYKGVKVAFDASTKVKELEINVASEIVNNGTITKAVVTTTEFDPAKLTGTGTTPTPEYKDAVIKEGTVTSATYVEGGKLAVVFNIEDNYGKPVILGTDAKKVEVRVIIDSKDIAVDMESIGNAGLPAGSYKFESKIVTGLTKNADIQKVIVTVTKDSKTITLKENWK